MPTRVVQDDKEITIQAKGHTITQDDMDEEATVIPGQIAEPARSVECLSQSMNEEMAVAERSEEDEAKSIPTKVQTKNEGIYEQSMESNNYGGAAGPIDGHRDSGEVVTELGWIKPSTI